MILGAHQSPNMFHLNVGNICTWCHHPALDRVRGLASVDQGTFVQLVVLEFEVFGVLVKFKMVGETANLRLHVLI